MTNWWDSVHGLLLFSGPHPVQHQGVSKKEERNYNNQSVPELPTSRTVPGRARITGQVGSRPAAKSGH